MLHGHSNLSQFQRRRPELCSVFKLACSILHDEKSQELSAVHRTAGVHGGALPDGGAEHGPGSAILSVSGLAAAPLVPWPAGPNNRRRHTIPCPLAELEEGQMTGTAWIHLSRQLFFSSHLSRMLEPEKHKGCLV